MFFEFAVERMPDLGRAVRERGPGISPVAALHRYVRAELERRAEWTGFHDGVAEFARVTFSSPTPARPSSASSRCGCGSPWLRSPPPCST
jgi:hypothetical protein